MTSRKPASNIQLKKAILKGIYQENLRIVSAPAPRPPKKASRKNKPSIFFFLLFVPVLVFLVGLELKDVLVKGQTPDAVAVTAPPVSVEQKTDQQPYPFEVKWNTDDLFKPVSVEPVTLDTDVLLNYSLILNDANVRLSSVFGLGVQTIVIDPGHGGKDSGATGAIGTKEKDIVLDIALGLRDKLRESGKYNVFLTRESDTYLSLADRVKFANAGRTDLFISLHINALPQKQVNMIETYYYGPPSDEETLQLAEQENNDSGVQTKDFADMIKKIGNTFKEQESANLAAAIQKSLFTNIKNYDENIGNAGLKLAPFVVLLGVDAPSVLVEISCISNKQEEAKLNQTTYRSAVTSFLAEGIIHYLNSRDLHLSKGEIDDKEKRDKSS
jgi:N-acetylmuramoyl-L-alanine amidase